ncbi:MAG: DNA-protecting protein DprA [candidate division Zixibacteria bacterium]|nr:DNA-protecting protein DprA [candidate division Zixibacteria bacterium]
MSDYNKELLIALREKAKLGSKTFQMLLSHFQSLENIVDADIAHLAEFPRISEKKAAVIHEIERHLDGIREDLESYREDGIGTLTIFDEDYPKLLRQINNPPFVLYCKGHFPTEDEQTIAIVGTTQASAEGIEIAVAFSNALADAGSVIVSGLARGIDTAAHMGALKAEGKSYAVLGCGINHIYPPENKRLSEELLEKGALISEYPPNTKVTTGRLISRNRIIVGLAQSVIIGELDKKSRGTINAAERARELGKLLFAIGRADLPVDPGLIEYGAIPLEDINKAEMISDHSL